MNREVISYSDIQKFPFEGIVFAPCLPNGETIEGASSIHCTNGKFLELPFDKDINEIKLFENYIMYYK